MQIVLAATRIPLPGAAAEDAEPVIRRRAFRLGIRPHVPVGARVVAAGAAFGKPRVLVGGVAQYQVDQHLQAQLVGAANQRAEIVQRAEHRVHIAIIRHVVAEVGHRRGKER
ncbi:hypothetical protein D3C85_1402780 [compost metagenome]